MNRLLIVVFFLFGLVAFGDTESNRYANRVRSEVEHGRLEHVARGALNGIFRVACIQLRLRGSEVGCEYEEQWAVNYQNTLDAREIGDHRPLLAFLALAYEAMEFALVEKLGHDTAEALLKSTHLSDLKTLNFCLPPAFSPCEKESWDKKEFQVHMVHGAELYGLYPVLAFWLAEAGCTAATYGAGTFFVCSPMATLSEIVMDRRIAEPLSSWVYDKMCPNP